MKSTSDIFTQGGQTQIHKLHMIKQVIGSTSKVSLSIFFTTFILFFWWNHCWQDLWLLLCAIKAWIRVDFFTLLPKDIFNTSWIVNGQGVNYTITDCQLHHSYFYQSLIKNIWMSLLKGILISIGASILGFFLLSWFWMKSGKKKQTVRILRGFECVDPKTLLKKIRKSKTSPYTIANIPIPFENEYQHMMVTGTTGSGKSNMIHQLLIQIRNNGDQAIILDTTGGLFSRFFDDTTDLFLNPFDQRSKHWDMWKEATHDSIIDEIAESIVVGDHRSIDSFWIQNARELFAESFRFLKKSNQTTYKDLLHMALHMDLKQLTERLKKTSIGIAMDPSIDKTALSIRSSLANALKIFKFLDDDYQDDGISFMNFMKTNHSNWVFLSCETNQRATLKSLFSTWLSLIIKGIMTRQENNGSRTWIIIDELASLSKLSSLMIGLAEIRKYGGCFVLGFQDLSQIEEIYGSHNAKSLSNLTGTKVLFRAIDTDIASRTARYMGEQEKEELSTNISYGAHQMRDGVNLNQQKLFTPTLRSSDMMLLLNLEAFLKYPGNFPVAKIKFDYMHIPQSHEIFIPKEIKETREEEQHETNPTGDLEPHLMVILDHDNSQPEHAKQKDLIFNFH